MPYKNKKDANVASRKRYAEDPEVKRKAKAAVSKWMDEHREENNEYRAAWAKTDREKHREQYAAYEFAARLRKYKTSIEWYRDKLIEQNGLCALCSHLSHFMGRIQSLSVDHSHECCETKAKSCGKCNRGLLCTNCNMLLSYFEQFLEQGRFITETDSWTARALTYLASYQKYRAVSA